MYRLIYKSRSPSPLDWDTVVSILHDSKENNEKNQIGGFLMATRHHFLQVVEGKFEDVNTTFMRIVRDPRHTDIVMLSYEVIDSCLFENWGMKGIGVFGNNDELSQRLIAKFGEEDGGVRFPRESWMALALILDVREVAELPEWKR
ncbi:MAG: BLUF domain-containing protein [Betaproteobacteria bacterium]|nr:BLUF domain-containing protein [Betaproteobacteria bacterium]